MRPSTDESRGDISRVEYQVESEGFRLFVREVLPAPVIHERCVIFVHGLTFPSIVDFDLPRENCSLCEYLALRGVRCCIFDLRGYGKSDKPPYGSSVGMAERARDVAAVYKAVGQHHPQVKIVLCGLSSGCNTIAEFLACFPEQPHALAFIAPCFLMNPMMRTVLRRARFIRFLLTLIGRPRSVYASLGRPLLRRRLYKGEERLIDRDTFEQFVNLAIELTCPGSTRLRAPVLTYPDPKSGCKPWAPLFNAKVITAPLLILRGEKDEFCCQRSAEALARDAATNDIRLITLKERNHDIHLYKNHDDYFSAILDFIAGI